MIKDPEGFYQMRRYFCTAVCTRPGQLATPSTVKTIQFPINSNEPTLARVREEAELHLIELGWVIQSLAVSPVS